MRFRRFRLRTLMILVLLSGLVMAGFDQIRRMDVVDWTRVREGSLLFVPFLVMIVMKLGLVIGARARRRDSDDSTKPDSPDEALS